MADPDDPIEAAARLEGALERIALLAARASLALDADPQARAHLNENEAEVARRLDSLIARLRAVLELPRS